MRLVIDSLSELDTRPCRLRPVDGYRAVQMPHAFSLPGEAVAVQASGEKGDYIVIDQDDEVAVISEQDFHEAYMFIRPKTTSSDTAKEVVE